MHCKNGREAKDGDAVICTGYNGQVTVGKIHSLVAGSETCNCTVAEVVIGGVNQLTCRTVSEMYPRGRRSCGNHSGHHVSASNIMRFVSLTLLALCGCTIAPHGSRATHDIWLYDNDGRVWRHERFTDRSAGGGALFFMDPSLQNVTLVHTNSELHTGGALGIGSASVILDPQTGAVISAAGTAVGNIVGAALKTAVKP